MVRVCVCVVEVYGRSVMGVCVGVVGVCGASVMKVWWECGVCGGSVSVLTGIFSPKGTMWKVGQVYLLTFDLTRS